MDKRIKHIDRDRDRERKMAFYEAISQDALSVREAVKTMRKLSKQTQAEFAQKLGLSLNILKAIEAGKGNPTVETLNKIGKLFGLEAGFKRVAPSSPPPTDG